MVDAFAGVGPFAVPAGKKGCGVLASDLEPASASALAANVKKNKVSSILSSRRGSEVADELFFGQVGENVRTGNQDARDFIRRSVIDVWTTPFSAFESRSAAKARESLERRERDARKAQQLAGGNSGALSTPLATTLTKDTRPPRRLVNHFVMNLPNSAIEFLDAYRGLYTPLLELEGAKEAIEAAGGENGLPLVHCYCFTKDVEGAEADILAVRSFSPSLYTLLTSCCVRRGPRQRWGCR